MRRSIVITGASSGIGKALAQRLAAPDITFGLLGRDPQKLESVVADCRQYGAKVFDATIDVRDRGALNAWLTEYDAATPIDLLVANAGVMGGSLPGEDIERPETSLAIAETNIIGVLNSIHPVMPRMIERGSGQIAILSSIAGFLPLPDAPTYAASKVAVLNYGLALRGVLRKKGVKVSVICPGYVETPMMEQETGAKPFAMPPERAVELILHGLERDKSVITFPRFFSFITRMAGLLPERVRELGSEPFRFKVTERK